MRSAYLAICAVGVAVLGGSVACSSIGDAASFNDRNDGTPSGGASDGGGSLAPSANNGDSTLGPTDNGVIMVHAAGLPAFRLCFFNQRDLRPQPDAEVMPDANVVGVEVGSAVRIAPLRGAPGKVYIFEEPLIRDFAGDGPNCDALLGNPTFSNSAHEMPAITTDLSKGVHLLVVAGCSAKTALRTYTKAECGDDYNDTTGNLHIVEKELKGGLRNGDALPTQVVHLSQPLETARAGGKLSVTFGELNASTQTSSADNPVLFGDALDLTAAPSFDSTKESVYDEVGFRVSIGSGVVAKESLADVQKQSAPRDIPTTYYSAASNYVLLLLGDPAAKAEDGGPSSDPLRTVHLLAVPVIEPKGDGGVEGGALDGGSAPDSGI